MKPQTVIITAIFTMMPFLWISCGSGGGGGSSSLDPEATFAQEPWVNTTWKLMKIGSRDVSGRNFKITFRRNNSAGRVDYSGAQLAAYWDPFQMLFHYNNNAGDSCVSTLNNMYISYKDKNSKVSGNEAAIATMNNQLAGYTCSCGPGYFQAATATGREWDDQVRFDLQKEITASKMLINSMAAGDSSTLVAYIILMAMAGHPVTGQYIAENPVLEFQMESK